MQKLILALYKTTSIYLAHFCRVCSESSMDGFEYIMFSFASPTNSNLNESKISFASFCLLIFFFLKLSEIT